MNCITISKTNRSGVRYILLDAIFGVADEIFVCSAVLYRRTRAPVHYRDPLSVEDLLGTLRRGRCFHAKRWKVSRCRPSRAAQLARRLARPPRIVARLPTCSQPAPWSGVCLEEDCRRKKEEEIKKGGHAAPLPRPAVPPPPVMPLPPAMPLFCAVRQHCEPPCRRRSESTRERETPQWIKEEMTL
jgi:hypothetical protein